VLSGVRVRVRGTRGPGGAIRVDRLVPLTPSLSGTADYGKTWRGLASAPAASRVAVVLFNFTNDTSQPWSRATVSNLLFAESNSVNAYFREVSYDTSSLTGDVFGWHTIPMDNSGCRYGEWANAAQLRVGADLSSYRHVVYAFPRASSCGWAGLASLGGRNSWINGSMTLRTVTHELGHNVGVHHASTLNCTQSGVRVTLSSSCTRSEYGDPFSIMGASTHHHNHWHRGQIGWLPEVITITSPGAYTVTPAASTVQPRLLRVPRGDGTFFYFEFRRPFGAYDNFTASSPVVNGVSIRLAPDRPTRTQSLLLDATPETSSWTDAPLPVGRTFSDPVSRMSVTTTAVSPAGATINVSFGDPGGDTQAPTAPGNLTATATGPDSIALAWTASTDNVGVAGYRVFRDGQLRGTTSAMSFSEGGLAPSTTYRYAVVAFDAAGNTSSPAERSVTTLTDDAEPPTAPTNLAARADKGNKVVLSWSPSSDNVGVAGYRLYRNHGFAATTTSTSYTDMLNKKQGPAAYYVVAFDAAGNVSPPSNTVVFQR
jgi:chitodextrinase